MEQPVFSVSQLISVINQTFEYAYPSVVVEGEVASFKVSKGKFVFFDVKDDDGAIGCFMMVYQLRHALEDGMRVRLVAQPRLTAWGKFSLTVREVLPVGEGNIKRAFQLLYAKLEKEGLFDAERKRALPKIPQRVGVIASVESAGYADFLKILNARWGGVELDVADVQVQGTIAARQIERAISYFNERAELPEVLVIIRGGGSAEDLSVFNEEPLVRAVAASRIPTIVGVGHEVDTSLCDLAADVRAATPSNAAQLLVPDKQAMAEQIMARQSHLIERIRRKTVNIHTKIATAGHHMIRATEHAMLHQTRRVAQARALLKQLNPKVVLQRGYALVRDDKGKVVRGKAEEIKPGSQLTVETTHAIIRAGVTHVDQRENTEPLN